VATEIGANAPERVSSIWAARLLDRPGRAPGLRDTAIVLDGARIASVTAGAPRDETALGGTRTLALPALCNAHDHGRGLRPTAYGVADDAVELWVPGTYTLPPLDPYLVAAVALGRMAMSGTGTIMHCHLFRPPEKLIAEAEAVARAAREIGVRVGFVVPLRDRNRLGYGDDDAILGCMDPACRTLVAERFQRPLPGIGEQLAAVEEVARRFASETFHVQYGPIGVEWCSDTLLERVAADSARTGMRVHMHLQESRTQREWADAAYPDGIVSHLDRVGLLTPRLSVAHAVWLRPDECALLAARGVAVSVNTTSNLRLRSGIAPMAAMRAAKLGFGLGMDSLSLDDDDDMLRETRLAWRIHRGWGFDDVLDAAAIFEAATARGPAIVMGESGFGTVAPGAPGDLLLLDYDAMTGDMISGALDEADAFLARATQAHVRHLVVAGRLVVKNGALAGMNLRAAERELTTAARAHAPDLAQGRATLDAYRDGLRRFYRTGEHKKTHGRAP
jgi:cytosine/adenosine deaminase-related metal-dependent hydrolase